MNCAILATITSLYGISVTAPAYGQITNIGTFGGTFSEANAVSDAGHVVGRARDAANRDRAFLWTAAAGLQDLGTVGGTSSQAYAVNSSGVVVGDLTTAGGILHAFRYVNSTTGMQDLGTPGGPRATAYAINDAGVIGGGGLTAAGDYRAFRYTDGGGFEVFGTLGGAESQVNAVNNAGMLAGYSHLPSGRLRAVRRTSTATGWENLGATGDTHTVAEDINVAGVVAGWTGPAILTTTTAIRIDAPDSIVPLPGLGGAGSSAFGINDAGFVVGFANLSGADGQRAALWRPDGTVLNLDAWLDSVSPLAGANWTLRSANDLNNSGLVVGWGNYNDGAGGLPDGDRAFVLDASAALPEPAAGLLTLFTSVQIIRRRRRG
jgi:probable HAF family extracellular repeat protein